MLSMQRLRKIYKVHLIYKLCFNIYYLKSEGPSAKKHFTFLKLYIQPMAARRIIVSHDYSWQCSLPVYGSRHFAYF